MLGYGKVFLFMLRVLGALGVFACTAMKYIGSFNHVRCGPRAHHRGYIY